MNELALFAGAGGGILGGHLLGWKTVAAVEIEEYPRAVLLRRQLDGIIPKFPIWDDIRTFDGKQFKGKVDIITGGFPCQDISISGKGIEGERSGLWSEMSRIIGEIRPRYVLVENSPMLTIRGLGIVLRDISSMGYNARWGVIGACDAGAPHKRDRIWIVANTRCEHGSAGHTTGMDSETQIWPYCAIHNQSGCEGSGDIFHTITERLEMSRTELKTTGFTRENKKTNWWTSEPLLGRVVDELANGLDGFKANEKGVFL